MEHISIIVPVFNSAQYVSETVNSIIAQTHQNWEAIVVDDCSTDSSPEILAKIAKTDSRIRIIHHVSNLGVSKARNTGLDAARGSIIAFLDSDDIWLPEKLESQLTFMKENNYGFTFSSFRRMTADGMKTGVLRPAPANLNYYNLLKNTAIATSTVVIDRRKTGDFRMPSIKSEDFATWLSILKRGIIAYGLNIDLMRYRLSPQSLSRNKLRSAQWIWRVYREAEQLSLPLAAFYFSNYAVRGYLKYRQL